MARSLPTDLAPTRWQRVLIRLTWDGLTDRQIGAVVGRSERAVLQERHRAHRRLGLVNRGDPRTMAAVWLWRQEQGG